MPNYPLGMDVIVPKQVEFDIEPEARPDGRPPMDLAQRRGKLMALNLRNSQQSFAGEAYPAAEAATGAHQDIRDLNDRIRRESTHIQAVRDEINKVMVGQTHLVERVLIALLADGHILLEGVPGLAKTLLVSTTAQAIHADFSRIQFTPDLLPADLIGTQIYNPRDGSFSVHQGPLFANLILADEINRAPAKVQSALLEVMQEKQVTIAEETYRVDRPFLVLATQNPVEQEGTYRLPEAQLDRFMMKVNVGYNTLDEEFEIVSRVAAKGFGEISQVAGKAEIARMQQALHAVHVDDAVQRYMLKLVFATRFPKEYGLSEMAEYIEFGASPRASIDLFKASRAVALIRGKEYVTPVDIAEVLHDVLRHRVILNYKAEAAGIGSDDVVKAVQKAVRVP
jgi:MoxR-like ATPase